MGAGGPVPPVPGSGGLPGDRRRAAPTLLRPRGVHGLHPEAHSGAAGRGGRPGRRLRPGEAHLLHLPQDVRPEQDHGRDLRPVRLPGHRGRHLRVLQRSGLHPRPVQAGAGPVQGLYRHPQAQHVPIPAHHRHRPGGHPLRGADPHLGDAPHGGIRRGRPLEIQAGHGQRQAGYRRELRVGAQAAGEPAGHRRRGLCAQPEGGPVRRRGVRVYPPGGRGQPARRGHAHRLCLLHPLRRGQLHDGVQGQRPHRHL